MQVQHPFKTVTPTLDGEVLTVLANADAGFTPPQVHRLIGDRSEAGVRKALKRLVEQGIVTDDRVGQAVSYRLNRRHVAAPHIMAIARLFDELLDRIRAELARWEIPAQYAALFGSAARGQMRPDSDIDLLVVRPDRVKGDHAVWREQLERLAQEVTAWTGNDARVLELSATEVRLGLVDGEPMYDDIRRDGVRLHGPTGYLRRALAAASLREPHAQVHPDNRPGPPAQGGDVPRRRV
jgi:predicted nucleotidyltransferase